MVLGASNGPSVWAVIGAVTGIAALLWNIWRGMREGPRLHVAYYAGDKILGDPEHPPGVRVGSYVGLSVSNYGTITAYVDSVGFASEVPWHYRWPLVKSLPFTLRRRRWARRMMKDTIMLGRSPAFERVDGQPLEPGQAVRERRDDLDTDALDALTERPWVVIGTGLRRYCARLEDHRGSETTWEPERRGAP